MWISCGKGGDNEASKAVFRMNLAEGLTTLDPAFARDKRSIWMTTQLFNGLVELDSNLRVRPALANRWEISPDGLTYRFYLKDSAWFHPDVAFESHGYPSRRVKASDFVYSFTRICDPATASTGAWIFNGKIAGLEAFQQGEISYISGFEALSDTVLSIHLLQPFPPFLGLLAMPYGFVVPHEAIDHYGEDFRIHPVGTGAFRFFRWEPGHHLILHKNDRYFEFQNGERLPFLDAVSVRFIPSKLSAFVEFVQGRLDLVDGLDESYRDEILNRDGTVKASYREKYQFALAPQLNTEYLGIQVDPGLEITQGHPLSDVRVRKALNYAIDREKLVRYLLNGMGYPAQSGFIPYGMPGFDAAVVQGFHYDPARSRQLLREAGFPDGKGLPVLTLYSTPTYAHIAEFVQKAFENIGVRVEVQNLQGGALRSEVYGAKINFWRASWIADYPDGENYLSLFYSPNFSPEGPNTTHFSDKRFDSLFQAALKVTDDTARYAMYQEMDRRVIAASPVIPLYYDRSLRILQPGIRGLMGNPMNHLHLKTVKKR